MMFSGPTLPPNPDGSEDPIPTWPAMIWAFLKVLFPSIWW